MGNCQSEPESAVEETRVLLHPDYLRYRINEYVASELREFPAAFSIDLDLDKFWSSNERLPYKYCAEYQRIIASLPCLEGRKFSVHSLFDRRDIFIISFIHDGPLHYSNVQLNGQWVSWLQVAQRIGANSINGINLTS